MKVFVVTVRGTEQRFQAEYFHVADNGDMFLIGPRMGSDGLINYQAAFQRGTWESVHEESAKLTEVGV